MATSDKVSTLEVTLLEKLWIKKSLETQRAALNRSLNKEIIGSDIYGLRAREIQVLDSIIVKVS